MLKIGIAFKIIHWIFTINKLKLLAYALSAIFKICKISGNFVRIDKYIFICSIYRKHEICGPLSSKVTIYNLSGRRDVSEYDCSYTEIVVGNVAEVEFKYKIGWLL